MKFLKLNFTKLIVVFSLFTFAHAATVTMDAKYGKTGGIAGNLNSVNNMVNGRNICLAVNDNTNGTPGCDMSDNPALNDNGTQNDASDDYYTGDMVVRTNDSFEAIAAYSWNGVAGGAEEQVTITGTLPAGKGFIWDGIPGSCKLPGSTLSADKKTIICVKKDFDTNDVGSFAEDMSFAVKVEGDALNGSKPGYISFSVDTPSNNNAPSSDTTQTTNGGDDDLIVITASPRWNIDKSGGAGYYTLQYGQTNPNTNELGYIIWYNFMIEVDEVSGEIDNPINPSLGNEAMQGGSDATVTFTDDLSQISPNAVLATWSSTGCGMVHSNGDEPYPVPNATYPDRSISAPNGPLAVTCTQTGQLVSVIVEHVDATLTNAPIKNRNGGLLPVNRKIAAIGTIKVFVPLSDVEKGPNGVDDGGNGDDGELTTTNTLTDFEPKGISGTDNFNGLEESEADNNRSLTLYAARGSWSKSYRKGWGDTATQKAQWGGGTWYLPPTDASIVRAGDGTANPGTLWGTYNYYGNAGGTVINNPMICDVIDIETFEMAILDTVDDPGTAIDDTIHAVDINHGYTETLPNIKVEYAIGYVGTWPPDPTVAPAYKVADECNATSITWYPDYAAAKVAADAVGTAVSKVRMSADSIPPSQYMSMRIKHRARANYLSSSNPIPNKTLLVNYAIYKSSLTSNKYISNAYRPHDADTPHEGATHGDRLIMQRAKVRILKDMTPTNVSPASEVAVRLTASFTVDGPNPQMDTVVIADLLPKGLAYKAGSTLGDYGTGNTPYGEPTVISPATDADCNLYASAVVSEGKPCGTLNGGTGSESIVYWDLGTQTTGTDFRDINFTAIVTVDAPQGVLANYTQIESPADDSAPAKRIDNANVNNSVPSSLLMVKSVQTPLHEINKGSLLNWMEFEIGVRNGSTDVPLTNLDIIDILPFNGDGVMGSFTFTPSLPTIVSRNRTPATNFSGTFVFDSMSFNDNGGQCDAGNITYWFTEEAGPLNISPVHGSNAIPAGSNNWCEGTDSGPNGACGFSNTTVTAIRVRGIDMATSATCYLKLKFATQGNVHDDIYSNTASAKAIGVTNAVLSNTVSAKVFASSIGDKVWFDEDKDGVQDVGEPGIDGVTVNLYDSVGTLIATTITSGGGLYSFPNLVSADYVVEVVPLVGYLVTGKNLGGNSALDSDIATDTNRTDTISLGEGEDKTDIDAGLQIPVISGNIFQDGDGNNDVSASTGIISTASGTQLHATLLDDVGAVLATTPIAADGTYSFGGLDGVRANTNYSVVLATTPSATASDLPTGWNNTGENINSAGNGNDGTANGIIAVAVEVVDVPQVDFGINHQPVAQDATEPSQLNPGGNTQVNVPDLNVTDIEDGTPTTVTIATLPNNAILYYNGTVVIEGQEIPNFDNSLLTVDPIDGDQTVVFNYTTIDAAGVVSDPATVTMPFTGLSISGHVFDDGNGDNNINGTLISTPSGTQLYATLVDASGTVIASKPIAADGTYNFDGTNGVVPNTNYTVVLSDTNGSKIPKLPTNWNNADGEQSNNAGTGNDGTADGVISVVVGTSNVPNNDFGINHKPIAQDATEPSQLNPGGNTQVNVPDLNVTDIEDGTPTTVTIATLPNNAILYYNGTVVIEGQEIPNFDNSLLTVDPIDGDQTVVFNYTTIDAAGVVSDPAIVTMPFIGLGISGTLFNDSDGDANVNGTPISTPSGIQLYVNLVDDQGNVIAAKPLASDGSYQFLGTDGVTANTNYTIVLSTTQGSIGQTAPTPDLPVNWNNTGENINSVGAGNDGGTLGLIVVSLGTVGVPQVDFGINHKPTAEDVTEPSQVNPAGNIQYPVPDLNISDTEDGIPTTVTIKTLPDATTGVLYYNGTPVTEGQVIPNFDNSLLTVDPTDGSPTMIFTYTTTDAAGVESDPATVAMPFLGDIYVGDRVWLDDNGNGLQDAGENGVAGVTVKLYKDDGTLVGTKDTNSTGEYIFKVQDPGSYYIEFDSAYSYTTQNSGDDALDSDVDPSTFKTGVFTLSDGQTDLNYDAGITPTAHIGDYFWIDVNANGIQEAGEEPVIGAIVELFDANGNPMTDANGNHSVITDNNGKYGFDVEPGTYQVKFTLPETGYEGYVFSNANQGDDGTDTDVNNRGFTQVVTVVAGQNVLTLDAGINCGCSDVSTDSSDAQSMLSMLVMMLLTLMIGLFFVRKEEALKV